MKYLEAIFKLWCILTVSFMIGYWIYKFNKNEDITLIEYRLVTELDGIPSHENPNIHYAKRECGIEKCTHVRGVINSTFGETTINQFCKY